MSWRVRLQEGEGPLAVIDNQKVLVGNPRAIWGELSRLEWGDRISEEELYQTLAAQLGADRIDQESLAKYLRIVCETSLEDFSNGAQLFEVAPFWRAVDAESDLSKRLSCGQEWIVERQSKESGSAPLEKAMCALKLEWPTEEEVGNDPIELLLDIRISHRLGDHFIFMDEFADEGRCMTTCCMLYDGKPWWGVIRNLCFVADYPTELEFPLYEEFEGTEMSGFEFAEVITQRIGKPFERIIPTEQPIPFEVWDYREAVA